MKAHVQTKRKFYKTILNSNIAGEYYVNLLPNKKYIISLVGAGGGVAGVIRDLGYGWSALVATGGSGAYIKSEFSILQQTETQFKVTIGQGGDIISGNQASTVGGEVNKGTATTFSINDILLLSCEGGMGGRSPVEGGAGGVYSVSEEYDNHLDSSADIEECKSGQAGVYFIEHHPKGDANYGSPWCRTNTSGGLSAYNYRQYGYGSGGGCVNVTPYKGHDGFCQILMETTEDDYDFSEDEHTYSLPAKVDREYYYGIGD